MAARSSLARSATRRASTASSNSITFGDLTNFQTYTISELVTEGWDLDSIVCSVAVDHGGTRAVDGRVATIQLAEGEAVSCVFSNTESAPATTTTTSTTSSTTSSTSTTSTTIVDPSSTTTTEATGSTTTVVSPSTTDVSPTTTERRRFSGSTRTIAPTTTTGVVATLVATTVTEAPELLTGDEELPATGGESRPLVVLGILFVFTGLSSLTLLGLRRILNGR